MTDTTPPTTEQGRCAYPKCVLPFAHHGRHAAPNERPPTTDTEPADPLVRAWRRWSDRFARNDGGDTPIRDAFAAGWDAALAAERASGGLDVERLAQSLANIWPEPGLDGEVNATHRSQSRQIAAEYARLATPQPGEPTDAS